MHTTVLSASASGPFTKCGFFLNFGRKSVFRNFTLARRSNRCFCYILYVKAIAASTFFCWNSSLIAFFAFFSVNKISNFKRAHRRNDWFTSNLLFLFTLIVCLYCRCTPIMYSNGTHFWILLNQLKRKEE